MSDEATVLTEEADGVLVITINRPEAKNAVNLAVAQGVAAALERLDSDDSLRVGVLTGAGGTFCAGMDLKAFVSGEFPHIDGRGFGGMTERSADKPLIAAVEGYALAGGCELAIACDLIIAADNAKFGIPEVKRGLVAAAGGLVRLPSQIPYRVAMELALTGESWPLIARWTWAWSINHRGRRRIRRRQIIGPANRREWPDGRQGEQSHYQGVWRLEDDEAGLTKRTNSTRFHQRGCDRGRDGFCRKAQAGGKGR